MTLARQERHKARAAREAEPFRQARLEADLRAFYASGEDCVIRVGGLLGSRSGVIIDMKAGEFVQMCDGFTTSNVPWRQIVDVRPLPEPRVSPFVEARRRLGTWTDGEL